MDRETIPAPPRHPVDLPRFSSLKGALRPPRVPTRLGPYDCSPQSMEYIPIMEKLIAVALALVCLGGCTEHVFVESEGTGGSGGETQAVAEQPTNAAAGGSAPSTTEAVAPVEPLCVPGESVECACPGGGVGAQVCAADGQSFGVCDCEPEVVTETVTVTETATETIVETVAPDGYSGECTRIGVVGTDSPCSTYPVLYVNCTKAPRSGCGMPVISANDGTRASGIYCCILD